MKAGGDDVVVLLQFVHQSVSPPQLANQLGRLDARAVLDLLDDGAELFGLWRGRTKKKKKKAAAVSSSGSPKLGVDTLHCFT